MPIKALERAGRGALVHLAARLFGARKRAVTLPATPKILVVRLDERLGNLLLLTPFLQSLRLRFPKAKIDLLANERGRTVLGTHPAIDTFLPFQKRALFSAEGPLAAPWRLRQGRYDLCIDVANPTDPSATQALLTLFSGAEHCVGTDMPPFGALYTAAIAPPPPSRTLHEIDLRLRLLQAVPGEAITRQLSLGPLRPASNDVAAFLNELGARPFAVINIGARLREKRLLAEDYALIVAVLEGLGLLPVLTYGPAEIELARATAALRPRVRTAPPTDVADLAAIMARSVAVATCDTGPMHLAVAVGTPTCGIFISTNPDRFGYDHGLNMAIDARSSPRTEWLQRVYNWAVRLKVPRLSY